MLCNTLVALPNSMLLLGFGKDFLREKGSNNLTTFTAYSHLVLRDTVGMRWVGVKEVS